MASINSAVLLNTATFLQLIRSNHFGVATNHLHHHKSKLFEIPKKSNYITPKEIGEWVDDALEPPEFVVGDTPVTYYDDCKNDARVDNSVGLGGSLVGSLDGSLDGGLGWGLDGGSGGDGS